MKNLTLRVDADVVIWARMRALFARTSVNAVIRRFLEEYAAVPEAFREGRPPPWTPDEPSGPVDPAEARRRAGRAILADRREAIRIHRRKG